VTGIFGAARILKFPGRRGTVANEINVEIPRDSNMLDKVA